jgi:DNA-binding NarL/FixJ family response regulator
MPAATAPNRWFTGLYIAALVKDRLLLSGIRTILNTVPGMTLLSGEQSSVANVIIFAEPRLTGELLCRVSAMQDAVRVPQRMVLIVDDVDPHVATSLADDGAVVVMLRAQITAITLMAAITGSASPDAVAPDHAMRKLVELSQGFEHIAPPGSVAGLTLREIEVLQMLADGMSTMMIAKRLSYAERTIKNIVQEILFRTGTRNRTQAVAYAIRTGAL